MQLLGVCFCPQKKKNHIRNNIYTSRYHLPTWEISGSPGHKLPMCKLVLPPKYFFHQISKDEKILFMLSQVVHVGSNHAFGYKTQHGETYGRHTRCAVVFKVVFFTNPFNCVCFVCRKAVPVHLWWCLAQSLTSPTQTQTARVKGEISWPLGKKGLKKKNHSSSASKNNV